jgi:hypothetical protein
MNTTAKKTATPGNEFDQTLMETWNSNAAIVAKLM